MSFFSAWNLPGINEMLAVAIGGSIGSLARFLSSHYMSLWLGTTFPWGTLVVNVLGSFLIGFVATLAFNKPGLIDPGMRLFLTSGFAGGFTTFSALAFETFALYQRGEIMLVLANVGGNLVLGLIAVVIGVMLARLV